MHFLPGPGLPWPALASDACPSSSAQDGQVITTPAWMTWDAASQSIFVQPGLVDVGLYTLRVSAAPDQSGLGDLIGYDDFQLYVEEPCEEGFRFFKVTSFSDNAVEAMQCAALYQSFISYWEVSPRPLPARREPSKRDHGRSIVLRVHAKEQL